MGRWDELVADVQGPGIFDFTEIEAMQILTVSPPTGSTWPRIPMTRPPAMPGLTFVEIPLRETDLLGLTVVSE